MKYLFTVFFLAASIYLHAGLIPGFNYLSSFTQTEKQAISSGNYTFLDAVNKDFNLATLPQNYGKVILFLYHGDSCSGCLYILPAMTELAQTNKGEALFVDLNSDLADVNYYHKLFCKGKSNCKKFPYKPYFETYKLDPITNTYHPWGSGYICSVLKGLQAEGIDSPKFQKDVVDNCQDSWDF